MLYGWCGELRRRGEPSFGGNTSFLNFPPSLERRNFSIELLRERSGFALFLLLFLLLVSAFLLEKFIDELDDCEL